MSRSWFDLDGRVALVTGAGANGGIGHAIAVALAESGADLFLTDRNEAGLEQTGTEIRALGRRCSWLLTDHGNLEDITAMYVAFDAAFGQLDILVNNVAASVRKRPEQVAFAEWRKVLGIILDGTFLTTQEAGKRMILRQQGGCIINVGSIAGSSALGRGNFVYSVGKGGINQFTRELAIEWAPHGIRVNAILPCQTLTPGMRPLLNSSEPKAVWFREQALRGMPLGRFAEPEDMARAAVFLASDAARFITGHLLPVDGGNMAMNAAGSRVWSIDD